MFQLRLTYQEKKDSEEYYNTTVRSFEKILIEKNIRQHQDLDTCLCLASEEHFTNAPFVYIVVANINSHDETPCSNKTFQTIHGFLDKQDAINLKNNLEEFNELIESIQRNSNLEIEKTLFDWQKKHNLFLPNEIISQPKNMIAYNLMHNFPFFAHNGSIQILKPKWMTYDQSLNSVVIIKRNPVEEDEEFFL